MKKFNAQAETHSNQVGPPRASRPRTEVFEQNAQATRLANCVFHHLLTQKHTATGQDRHALHHLLTQNDLAGPPFFACLTQNAQADLVPLRDVSAIFFYFYLDYKHKHTADPVGCCRAHALNV